MAENRHKVPWRDHLTADEAAIISAAEQAKARWLDLNAERAGIVNRAIQRAKYRLAAHEPRRSPLPPPCQKEPDQ